MFSENLEMLVIAVCVKIFVQGFTVISPGERVCWEVYTYMYKIIVGYKNMDS